MRTDRLKHEFNVEINWKVFPLHPEIPDDGIDLTQLFAGRDAEIRAIQDRLVQVAESEGLPFTPRSRTYNSRRAQELGKWAGTIGKDEAFRKSVYKAYFAEGRNIARIDELLIISEEAGLPVTEAEIILSERSFASAVDADWQLARDMRITAVPTHICGGRRLAGFSPYENFVQLIGK